LTQESVAQPVHPSTRYRVSREDHARELAERHFNEIAKTHDKGAWSVPSCTGLSTYTVHYRRHSTHPDEGCSCPDFEHRGGPCKHLLAVGFVARQSTPVGIAGLDTGPGISWRSRTGTWSTRCNSSAARCCAAAALPGTVSGSPWSRRCRRVSASR
jgi:hypothetical protein